MGKTWDIQTGVPPYEAAHPYAVHLEKENRALKERITLLETLLEKVRNDVFQYEGFVSVQVPRATLDALDAALEEKP